MEWRAMIHKCWLLLLLLLLLPTQSVLALEDEEINVVIPQQRRDRDIYIIGDLHGDDMCAKHWVERIGVVDNVTHTTKWLKPNASLLFMGDYIDKGPYAYQTLLFVKSLTETFPNHVTALMGNHEMELLKDRHALRTMKYFYQISHVVHPSEYHNHIIKQRPLDDDDRLVENLLINATMRVYSNKTKKSPPVHFTPERLPKSSGARNPLRKCVVDYVEGGESKKALVRERLAEYQQTYLRAFASNTTLGRWMEQTLKIAHIENGVLFTHGGMDTRIATHLSSNYSSLDEFHQVVSDHLSDDAFFPFIINTTTGRLVEQMLYHRGNHKDGACPELWRNLELWGGVHILAVGHTPHSNIRLAACGSQFWALDALLGRWIRTSQGFHCHYGTQMGDFKCPRFIQKCHGQIIKIEPDGTVEVLQAEE